MKRIILVLILFITSDLLFSQGRKLGDNLIVFYTYEDFISNKGKDCGVITKFYTSSWGENRITVENSGKEEVINTNKLWGYKSGDYLYRMNKKKTRIPLLVYLVKDKVFYIDGTYRISEDKIMSSFASRKTDGIFYSDNLNSEVFQITKLIKNEKNNSKYNFLIDCLKEAKKRYGINAKFNGYLKCISSD
jgi:hypothetical protein